MCPVFTRNKRGGYVFKISMVGTKMVEPLTGGGNYRAAVQLYLLYFET